MKKSEMVGRVAGRMGLTKSAADGAVDAVFEVIAEALAKEEAVRIAGFGTFATRSRSARTGRNHEGPDPRYHYGASVALENGVFGNTVMGPERKETPAQAKERTRSG